MRKVIFALGCILACARLAAGTPIVVFSNLAVTNGMGAASRPDSPGITEIEAADDFLVNNGVRVTELKFIGLLTGGIGSFDPSTMNLEIYRVFPNDSQNPPDGRVPTRVNSPSDVAFAERGFNATDITSVTVTQLAASFTALNSVKNGIHPLPNVQTNGEGPVTGAEVMFDVVLKAPIVLPADHYFFVPQIGTNSPDTSFFWLSASRPIAGAGTTPFAPDLQAWIRNGNIDPDWLRIGTDIVGGNPAPTFNLAFEVDGDLATPEPGSLLLAGTGLALLGRRLRRKKS
jgi:PEP-CTERM motif-containing protein